MAAPARKPDAATRDVDFLPVAYREQIARRQGFSQGLIVTILFVAMLPAAHVAQMVVRRGVQRDLSALTLPHEATLAANKQLDDLQTRLDGATATAELYTYLQHPWPRTQILAAIFNPLPDAVTLREVRVVRDEVKSGGPAEHLSPAEKQAEEQRQARLSPAARDLKWLRDAADKAPTVVHVTGVTAQSKDLHRYLSELGKNTLFSTVSLLSIDDATADHSGHLRFNVSVIVRPGYGLPGGPAPTKDKSVVQSAAPQGGKTP